MTCRTPNFPLNFASASSTHADKVLLRVVVSPDFDRPREFTGEQLLDLADRLASSISFPRERSVVLLLLPHSPELFLLQLGLVFHGHIPAILAWPTSRVDPEKYQRNLVHQLSQLARGPADHAARAWPEFAGSLSYPCAGLSIENHAAFEKIFPAAPVVERLA